MKSIKGIWTLEFYGAFGWETTGILVLKKGRAMGGGMNHHTLGSYEVDGHQVRLELKMTYFGKVRTLFGLNDPELVVHFDGKHKSGEIRGTAGRGDRNVIPLQFRMLRRSKLD